jgi:hypothetical protein
MQRVRRPLLRFRNREKDERPAGRAEPGPVEFPANAFSPLPKMKNWFGSVARLIRVNALDEIRKIFAAADHLSAFFSRQLKYLGASFQA